MKDVDNSSKGEQQPWLTPSPKKIKSEQHNGLDRKHDDEASDDGHSGNMSDDGAGEAVRRLAKDESIVAPWRRK